MAMLSRIPDGPLHEKWNSYKDTFKPINPANKRKFHIIVVGTGLAGASAAASLGELGFNVSTFCFQDSPRRAHSIAAQGGINAAKNYPNDGDSVYRLFKDTVKGGDFRSREANVYRLAQNSASIIDQCVAQGVPFARDYGGYLDNRSFGGSLVSRTFYARGQTGQQLLLGAYSALNRQINAGQVSSNPRTELLDVVVVDGHAKGIIIRDLCTGELSRHSADAVVLATGGYSPVFYLSTNAVNCNVTAAYRAYKKGAYFANPCFTQIHPTCIPVADDHQSKLTLMSESLRNNGRVWVPSKKGDKRAPGDIPVGERDYYLERKYPSFGNLSPRDISSRAAKQVCDEGRGVGESGLGVYLDFKDAIDTLGEDTIRSRYGNLFQMYQKITDENPYSVPMRIFPAPHYTMGGLWVDYELMSNIPGLFVLGEANFSDHGANRLGASALMQGLSDGYFVLPYTIARYLNEVGPSSPSADSGEFKESVDHIDHDINSLLDTKGKRSSRSFHRELGRIMWEHCGMQRNESGLKAGIAKIKKLEDEFTSNVRVTGTDKTLNPELEQAMRVKDFIEFSQIMCQDALEREESCGGHFREEHQTSDGEALRDDENFCHASLFEYDGHKKAPKRSKEQLEFQSVSLQTRSYK